MYDVYEIRKLFPMFNNDIKMQGKPLVYLDNAATTFKPQCVIDAINLYYTHESVNAGRGDYDLAYQVDTQIGEARKTIARFVNSDENEVVFTSGTTNSINLIAYGYMRKFLHSGDEIVIDEAEHASNSLPWFKIANEIGVKVKFIPLDENGAISIQNLRKTLTKKTKLVALAGVSNVLGNSIDVPLFCKEIHKCGAVFALDGAQLVPHSKVDFKSWDIDFLSFSGHKMCGPTGIGCLIGKYELLDKMDTFIVGGGMNVTFSTACNIEAYNPPRKFEAGTLNIEGIIGLKAAAEFIMSIGLDEIHAHEIELQEYALSKLQNDPSVIIYNKNARNGIICFNKKDVFAQDEGSLLNYHGIAVRSGQHCAKMLVDYLGTPATCRMSLYFYNTKEDVDIFVDALLNGGDFLDAFFN